MSFESDRLCVVLVSTRNPLNIGAAARAMCNFGFQHLRVVNPYDPAFREARSAVGASTVIASAEEFTTVEEAIADCTLVVGTTAVKQRHLQHPLKTLADAAPLICDEIRTDEKDMRRAAVLFGSEKFGLSNRDLSFCHWLMHIPTGAEQPSMNLGQAVAVCLYELVRGEAAGRAVDMPQPAGAGELERLTTALIDALEVSGYMDAQRYEEKEQSVRRMVRRLNLSAEDATTVLGMLRQILWKLRSKL
jgi:TrmH family RNA methyltransferase